MTLRGTLTAQGNFKARGMARRPAILLSKAAQDAPARAHSWELNMPLACLLTSPALVRVPLAVLLAHTLSLATHLGVLDVRQAVFDKGTTCNKKASWLDHRTRRLFCCKREGGYCPLSALYCPLRLAKHPPSARTALRSRHRLRCCTRLPPGKTALRFLPGCRRAALR